MSLMKRISLIFRSKANKALDKAEDPRETLDYSYQRQLELLSKVRRGVADVATSRKRVELQVNQLEQQAAKLQGQAEKAIGANREDLAREALTRKSGLASQITNLKEQQATLQGEDAYRLLRSFFVRCAGPVNAFKLYAVVELQNANSGVTVGATVAAGVTASIRFSSLRRCRALNIAVGPVGRRGM